MLKSVFSARILFQMMPLSDANRRALNWIAIAIAALVMLGGFELLREFEQYRMLMFGLALVLIMLFRPAGLWPSKTRQRELAGLTVQPAASGKHDG